MALLTPPPSLASLTNPPTFGLLAPENSSISITGILVEKELIVAVLTDGRQQRMVDVTADGIPTLADAKALWTRAVAEARKRQIQKWGFA